MRRSLIPELLLTLLFLLLAATSRAEWNSAYGNTVKIDTHTISSLAGSTGPVTQAGTWTVQPGNTQNTVPWQVISTNTLVQGMSASDTAVVGNPVYEGARASTSTPVAVSGNGRVVPIWADWNGRMVVTVGEAVSSTPLFGTLSNTAVTLIVTTPSANTSLYLKKIMICNAGSSDSTVSLLPTSGGTAFFKALVGNSGGCTAFVGSSVGYKLAAQTGFFASMDTSTTMYINVMDYYIDP